MYSRRVRRARPPFRWAQAIFDSRKPKLFVQGDRDEFTGKDTLLNWAAKRSASAVTETRIYPGLGHFELEGPAYDSEIADVAADFAFRNGVWDAPAAGAAAAAAEARAAAAGGEDADGEDARA